MNDAGATTVDDPVQDRGSADSVAQAWSRARTAADRSSSAVEIAHDITDMRALGAVLDSIWHAESGSPEVEPRLMVALAEAGGYLAGIRVNGDLVGAAVGFPRHPTGLHSHIVGVLPTHAGRGVGTALKLHQRAWCLERGIGVVTWTFDPLVARNAHLNLTRLGVRAPRYLVDHYGPMNDALNSDDPSDRLLVSWDLLAPRTGEPPREPAVVVLADHCGEPFPVPDPVPPTTDRMLIAVPADIEGLRRTDPSLARRWRTAVRGTLHLWIEAGWLIEGFRSDRHYVLTRPGLLPGVPVPSNY